MGIQIIKPTEIFFFKDELECLEYYADYDSDEDVMGWKPYHHTAMERELWQSGYLERQRESFCDVEYDASARLVRYEGLWYLECLRHAETKAQLAICQNNRPPTE